MLPWSNGPFPFGSQTRYTYGKSRANVKQWWTITGNWILPPKFWIRKIHDFKDNLQVPNIKDKTQNIKGSLKRHNYTVLENNWYTSVHLRCYRELGYKLPSAKFPESVHLRNNKSAEKHAASVDEAISELVNSGRIKLVSTAPRVINLYQWISVNHEEENQMWGLAGADLGGISSVAWDTINFWDIDMFVDRDQSQQQYVPVFAHVACYTSNSHHLQYEH